MNCIKNHVEKDERRKTEEKMEFQMKKIKSMAKNQTMPLHTFDLNANGFLFVMVIRILQQSLLPNKNIAVPSIYKHITNVETITIVHTHIHTYKRINTQHINTCTIVIKLLIVLIQGSIYIYLLICFFHMANYNPTYTKFRPNVPLPKKTSKTTIFFSAKTVIWIVYWELMIFWVLTG